jgi:predicted enzyme related to lactoylglutathione lyase
MTMSNPVGWFEIHVADMARAKAFYEQLLGTQLNKLDSPGMDMMAFTMDSHGHGASGALVCMPGMAPGGNSTLVYFSSADCAIEAGRAEAAGGQVFKPKTSIGPYGFIALLIDTEGNMIGLHSMQ